MFALTAALIQSDGTRRPFELSISALVAHPEFGSEGVVACPALRAAAFRIFRHDPAFAVYLSHVFVRRVLDLKGWRLEDRERRPIEICIPPEPGPPRAL